MSDELDALNAHFQAMTGFGPGMLPSLVGLSFLIANTMAPRLIARFAIRRMPFWRRPWILAISSMPIFVDLAICRSIWLSSLEPCASPPETAHECVLDGIGLFVAVSLIAGSALCGWLMALAAVDRGVEQ